jgi:hypothetical protein
MRMLGAMAIAAIWLIAAVPVVSADPGRADTYYTFQCTDPDGNVVDAESVDAHAIEQGGKVQGSAHWQAAHPGWHCEAIGPFHN